MEANATYKIINLCLKIEQSAYAIYSKLVEVTEDPELREYWQSLAYDMYDRTEIWSLLSSQSQKELLPPLFKDEKQLERELQEILIRITRLTDAVPSHASDQFMLVYWVEFYLMHRAFTKVYHFSELIGFDKNPHDSYDSHINDFIYLLNKYHEETPQMRLIGEMLKQLWADHRKWTLETSIADFTSVFSQKGFYESVIPLCHFARRKSEMVGIAKLRIDGFNNVVEEYGQFLGDQLLRKLGKELKVTLRHSDIIGHFENDAFAIFLNNIQSKDFEMVLRKIQKYIEKNDVIEYDITISLGAVLMQFEDRVEEPLLKALKRANELLNNAREKGNSQLIIESCIE